MIDVVHNGINLEINLQENFSTAKKWNIPKRYKKNDNLVCR